MNIFKKLFGKKEVVGEDIPFVDPHSAENDTFEQRLYKLNASEQDLKIFNLVEDELVKGEYEIPLTPKGIIRIYTKIVKCWGYHFNNHYYKVRLGSKWYRLQCNVDKFDLISLGDVEFSYNILNRDIFSTQEITQLICEHWWNFFDDKREDQIKALRQKETEEQNRVKALQISECIKSLEGK